MLNEHKLELLQAGIDGELSGAKLAEFMQLLRDSEEARQFHEEMQRVTKLLSEIPQVEPPMGLNHRIMDSITLSRAPLVPDWLRNWFKPASYGLAVAAGVLLAVGAIRLVPDASNEMPALVGSMVGHDKLVGSKASDQLEFKLGDIQGSVFMHELEQGSALQFQLQSGHPVEVELLLSDSGLQFGGLADDMNGVANFEVSGGNVRVLNEGSQQFVVFLRSAGMESGAQELRFIIRQDQQTVYEGSIAIEG